MCGICGVVDFDGGRPVERDARVRAMMATIAHRGPDARGTHSDEYVSLGHRRLSIIDLQSGDQPISTEDGRFTLIFNGELYNFRELRDQLRAVGHTFRTQSDTEVVLRAFSEWGEDCVKRFNGMFAFAVWDARNRILFLARDRVGKKPLYYAKVGNAFVFASELKAIVESGLVSCELDPQALMNYISFGYVPAPLSILSSVRKLKPARCMTVSAENMTDNRYWTPSFGTISSASEAELIEELAELIDEAVRCRLVSDVPLGAFLSGGLDSSLVVASMARVTGSSVKTHTIGTPDPDFNETAIARQIAEDLGTEHQEFIVKPEATQVLDKIAWHLDEPFADPSALPSWYVCEMTRKSVTVALSGDGGDEAFGGYTFRYLPHVFESRVRRVLPAPLRALCFGALGSVWPTSPKLPQALRLNSIFRNLVVGESEAFYRDLLMLREDRLMALLRPEFLDGLKGYTGFELVDSHYRGNDAGDSLGRCQFADINFYMTDDVLVKVDRMSMAHGLEVRAPLLDYRVIEFAARLPARLKMSSRRGKLPLRTLAGQQLPRVVTEQPKRGFSMPVSAWLRGELRDMSADLTLRESGVVSHLMSKRDVEKLWKEHWSGRFDHGAILWALLMLGLWEDAYMTDSRAELRAAS